MGVATSRSPGATPSTSHRSSELGFRVVPNPGEVSREALIARIASWSQVASLPDTERESFLAEIAGDLTEPAYPSRLETHVYWARLGA